MGGRLLRLEWNLVGANNAPSVEILWSCPDTHARQLPPLPPAGRCVLDAMFDDNFRIKAEFLHDRAALQKRFQ